MGDRRSVRLWDGRLRERTVLYACALRNLRNLRLKRLWNSARYDAAMESPRILIADDQAHVREALALLLKNEGFVSETVSSPTAVVDAVRDRNFDVLLLDMNYARDTTSGDEGLELLSRIRELDTHYRLF